MQVTQQVLKAIETAIQIEKDGLAFYTEAAQQTQDPSAKRMFQSLAQDETAHLTLFQDARAALLEQESWPSPEQVAATSPGMAPPPQVFPTQGEMGTVESSERALAILQRGVQAEETSIAFYTEQMNQVDDPNAQALYAYLIEQEQVHRKILQSQHDFLARMNR